MSSLKQVVYNKILLLAIDLENAVSDMIIDKLFVYFNIVYQENDCTVPFLVKCIFHTNTSQEQDALIMNLEKLYSYLHYVPSIYVDTKLSSQYSYVDINNNVAPITEPVAIEHCKKYEHDYEEFFMMHSLTNIDEQLADVTKVLALNRIPYEVSQNNATVITIFKESYYPIDIVLSNISTVISPNIIIPKVSKFSGISSLGTFVRHSNRTITHAKQDHLALIIKCKQCAKNIVIDWIFNNVCPYCESKNAY